MHITRRHLRLALGALWLLDGVLQCQPIMFSRAFVTTILDPTSQGQPHLLAVPLHVVGAVVLSHPALANSAFAIIQLALGVALLSGRFTRVALGASIGWALSVWVVGEGLGGIAAGATLVGGAPGAALLYAVIAVLAWPARDPRADAVPSRLAIPAWCALWLGGAGLQLVSGNNSASSITMMLRGSQSTSPAWIAGIDRSLAHQHLPDWTGAAVAALYVLVAIWALVPGWTRRLSIGIGTAVALVSWLVFQGLGDLTSGQSTDVNCGPLIVLLALALVGATRFDESGRHQRDVVDAHGAPSLATRELTSSGGVIH